MLNMKRSVALIALLLGMLFVYTPVSAQKMTKEEEQFWKKKAKMYGKNPLSLKAEFENYQNQIKDLKKQNKDLADGGKPAGSFAVGTGSSELIDSLRMAVVQLEIELQRERSESNKLQKAYQTQKTVNDMGIQTGLVYRVQIGAFVFYEMKNTPQNADDFHAERSDGFNKYVVGSFRTQKEAEQFRDSMKTIGIKDPWVVPYIDGIRVTMQEADQYRSRQGSELIMGK